MKVGNLSLHFFVQYGLFDEELGEAHHHPYAHSCLRSGLLVARSKLLEAILSWKATRKHIGGKLEGAHVRKLRCHALIYSRTWPAQRPCYRPHYAHCLFGHGGRERAELQASFSWRNTHRCVPRLEKIALFLQSWATAGQCRDNEGFRKKQSRIFP